MAKNILRTIITLLGSILGLCIGEWINTILLQNGLIIPAVSASAWIPIVIYAVMCVLCGIVFFFLAPHIMRGVSKILGFIENKLTELSLVDLFFCVAGLLIGLVIAFLFSTLITRLPGYILPFFINTIVYISFAYLGISVVYRKRNDIKDPPWFKRSGKPISKSSYTKPKLLDTSAIIDGRVYDICRTGFLEGDLIIPQFVLDELRHISDSSDPQKRKRGRRGLDILKRLQDDNSMRVGIKVEERDYEGIHEVDAKLLKLAAELSGIVITMDYNLNKVASVQNVPVLNINELANAIKTVLLPGDELNVLIMQEGKEQGQGLAYMDDGTMIVVDGGRAHIGQNVQICVTSVLQTSAGKMVFAKLV